MPAANANTVEEHRKEAANVLLDLLHETAPIEPTKEVEIAKKPSKEPLVHDTDLIKTGPMDDSTHKEASKEVVQDTVSEIPPSKGPKKANESQKIKRKPLTVGRKGKTLVSISRAGGKTIPASIEPKKANESQNKKRKVPSVVNKGKSMVSVSPAGRKRPRKRPRKGNIDIPDLKDDYVEVPGTPPITHTETGIICQAGLSCHLQDINIVLEGNATNGSLCCKCEDNFHFVCLFRFEENNYCKECYKEHVVKKCDTSILFQDLFQNPDTASAQASHVHTEEDLLQHMDNFLNCVGLQMTTNQFYEWKNQVEQSLRRDMDKKKRKRVMKDFQFKTKKYEKVIELAKDDWLVSTDGVVNALHCNPKQKQFVAKV
jgi:hypothetical protein